jgi:rod shape determining protein RodA
VAIGSGKFFGKGLGNSSQGKLKFLPEKHTDFAFSVWAEQTGFLGSMIIIGLYSFIVIYSLLFLNKIRDSFLQVLLFGLSSYFFLHLLINISMTIGLFPVVGIPLLMFSYGGSSLICGAVSLSLMALIISEYRDVNRLGL